jgi:hypothetical protein
MQVVIAEIFESAPEIAAIAGSEQEREQDRQQTPDRRGRLRPISEIAAGSASTVPTA